MVDIRRWLAATDDRAPPPGSGDHCISGSHTLWADAHTQDRGEDRRGRIYRQKRRARASSDSSIIATREPKRADLSRADDAAGSLPSVRARSASHAESSEWERGTGGRSESTEAVPQKTYERRLRHKTRPDRYEPKQKRQKGDEGARREKKSRKRRKSHRSGDGGRTAGLVQSFQLKNGPKGNRLTVCDRR